MGQHSQSLSYPFDIFIRLSTPTINMQLTSIVAIGAVATAAAAINFERGFTYPAGVPHVDKRQTSGAKYECHSNCGYALQAVEGSDDVCDDDEWNTLYLGCLDCALEHDIWRYYGGGLTPAGEACGLSTTPTPADGGDDVEEPASTTMVQSATAVPVSRSRPQPLLLRRLLPLLPYPLSPARPAIPPMSTTMKPRSTTSTLKPLLGARPRSLPPLVTTMALSLSPPMLPAPLPSSGSPM